MTWNSMATAITTLLAIHTFLGVQSSSLNRD